MTQETWRVPVRVDFAGGTLDLWPIYAMMGGCVTVNAAVDLWIEIGLTRSGRGHRITSRDLGLELKGFRADADVVEGELALSVRSQEERARGREVCTIGKVDVRPCVAVHEAGVDGLRIANFREHVGVARAFQQTQTRSNRGRDRRLCSIRRIEGRVRQRSDDVVLGGVPFAIRTSTRREAAGTENHDGRKREGET